MVNVLREVRTKVMTMLPNRIANKIRKVRRDWATKRARQRLQKYGFEVMNRVYETLKEKEGIIYHVDFGTLLGLIRENGFLKHDDDIDFTIATGSIAPQELMRAMLDAGFRFMRGFVYDGEVTELAFTYKKIGVDFFYEYKSDNGSYIQSYDDFVKTPEGNFANTTIRLHRPAATGVETVEINGVKMVMPKNKEELLVASYGANWRTPITGWTRGTCAGTKQERINSRATMFYRADEC